MRTRWLAGHGVRAAAPLVMVTILAASGPGAAAPACGRWISMPIPSPGSSTNTLSSVAVLSPRLAWAVGQYSGLGPGRTLIERWDGTAWKQQASPNPRGRDSADALAAVAASSPSNACAVGWITSLGPPVGKTLIEHWDGTSWTHAPSPNPGDGDGLDAVAVTSSSDAWAVGGYITTSDTPKTLIEHWDGTVWTHVPSPSPAGYYVSLDGVAATSASDAWAVGAAGYQPLIEHWDGTAWARVPSPNPAVSPGGSFLGGVAASSPSNAWVVGSYWDGTQDRTLTLHWDGTAWARVPSPSVAHANSGLSAVTTTSPTSAWAVGGYTTGSTHAQTLILHWNGTTWSKVKSPNFLPQPSINALSAVSASSPTNIWTVGHFATTATTEQVAALHRC
jgi:hypothetical protein